MFENVTRVMCPVNTNHASSPGCKCHAAIFSNQIDESLVMSQRQAQENQDGEKETGGIAKKATHEKPGRFDSQLVVAHVHLSSTFFPFPPPRSFPPPSCSPLQDEDNGKAYFQLQ